MFPNFLAPLFTVSYRINALWNSLRSPALSHGKGSKYILGPFTDYVACWAMFPGPINERKKYIRETAILSWLFILPSKDIKKNKAKPKQDLSSLLSSLLYKRKVS